MKYSVQWPETHGHTEVRDYIPGGDAYADECQLDLGRTQGSEAVGCARGMGGGSRWPCWQ